MRFRRRYILDEEEVRRELSSHQRAWNLSSLLEAAPRALGYLFLGTAITLLSGWVVVPVPPDPWAPDCRLHLGVLPDDGIPDRACEFSGPRPASLDGVIEEFVAQKQPALEQCYQGFVNDQPWLAGWVVVEIDIGKWGHVTGAWADGGPLREHAVARCIEEELREYRFPTRVIQTHRHLTLDVSMRPVRF